MTKRCKSRRYGFADTIHSLLRCERKRGHKGRHRCRWREGFGNQWMDITARWH